MIQTEGNILQAHEVGDIDALVTRISTSPQLNSSSKLREFLRYIVDCAVRDAPQDATEQQIGIHVFARRPGYNSGDDSIVRSQARLLRMKLAAYFASEGAGEPVQIEIPKGHYLPVFRSVANGSPRPAFSHSPETDPEFSLAELIPASHDGETLPPAHAPASSPLTVPPLNPGLPESATRITAPPGIQPSPSQAVRLRALPITVLLVLLLALAFTAGVLTHRHVVQAAAPSPADALWAPFLSSAANPTLVIYSNPVFRGTPATGLHLTDPAVPLAPDSAATDDTYTGTGEASAIFELTRLFDTHAATFTLKRSRLVTWDEAKSRNLIFVGAPSQNTALRDLPATAEFSIALDPTGHGFIVNHHPQPGEPARFPSADDAQETAILALLPGLRPDRRILVFSGLTTIGTGALVEFACRPENIVKLLSAANAPNGTLAPFEAVFEIGLSHREGVNARILALHRH